MRLLIILLAAGIGVLGTILPRTYEIVRTPEGFEPSELAVRPGDMVRFRGTGTGFWPASDAHPSHAFYRAFDPQLAIPGDGSWEFAFERPGTWSFHDHLAPSVRGTIRVTGEIPPLDECLSFYGTSTAQAYCWGQALTATIAEKGLEQAFVEVEHMRSDPAFESQCHDVMHIIGVAAYAEYLSDEAHVYAHPMTSSCGFGYYHGLIEAMLVERGTGDLARARDYCEALTHAQTLPTSVSRERARQACYHGIGHAFFDTIDPSLWGETDRMVRFAEAQCERLTADQHPREICMSGVYNSLANAYSAQSYGLVPPPFADNYCATQRERYLERCYVELTAGMMRRERIPYDAAVAHIRSLPEAAQTHALRAFLDDEFRHYTADPTIEHVHDHCASFVGRERIDCIAAALRAFVYRSAAMPDTLTETLFRFCALQRDRDVRAQCVGKARIHLTSDIPDDVVRTRCAEYFDAATCDTPPGEL